MDPNQHQHLRFVLELLYFLSGAVLACVSLIALYQIILTKKSILAANESLKLAAEALDVARLDIQVRSKREAVNLASDMCERFARDVIPEMKEKRKAILEAGVSFDEFVLSNSNFDSSSIKDWPAAQRWLQQLKAAGQWDAVMKMNNLLESFAMYFAKGAADEHVAYSAVGAVFCAYVARLAPHFIAARTGQADGPSGTFQNTVELYKVWSSRMRREELEWQKARISSSLSEIPTSEIHPIGTRLSSQIK